jgi:hypothetical protein
LIATAEPGAPFDAGFRAPSPPLHLGSGASADTAGVLAAWRHGTAVHLGRAHPGGVSDVARFREREPRLAAVPDIVADSAGHGLLTWDAPASRTDDRKTFVRVAALRPGDVLGPRRTLVELDSFFTATAAVGSDGTGVVGWLQAGRLGLSRVQARVLRQDGSWGPVVTLSRGAGEDFDPPYPPSPERQAATRSQRSPNPTALARTSATAAWCSRGRRRPSPTPARPIARR